jgi:hypothetical protein
LGHRNNKENCLSAFVGINNSIKNKIFYLCGVGGISASAPKAKCAYPNITERAENQEGYNKDKNV